MEDNIPPNPSLPGQGGNPAKSLVTEHNLDTEIEEEDKEEEYDRYKDNPDLLNETKIQGPGGSRLFSYDW